MARSSTPVSPTGGRNSCRHSGFQVLCSCRGYVIFHNQPKGSRVLASSLSSDPLNVSERFTEGRHQQARGSGCCVWVNVDGLAILVPSESQGRSLWDHCPTVFLHPLVLLCLSMTRFTHFYTEVVSSLGQYVCLQCSNIPPQSSPLGLGALNHAAEHSTHPVSFQSVPLISQHAIKCLSFVWGHDSAPS